ncbi:hypothetical protein CJU90_1910 [Yarrowia sp. C11]|nr:hypothetical protein CKK34_5938 [Yarrowia sp. E02]KAG5371844.1 hypothetical protein CJU90_1910 [Yarrowia sp. C11]
MAQDDIELGLIKDKPAEWAPESAGSEKHIHRPPWNMKLFAVVLFQVITVGVVILHFTELETQSPLGLAALICLCLSGLSQGITQAFITRRSNYSQLFKFYVWGVINGVTTKMWTDMLIARVPVTILRVLIDQLCGNPGFQLMFLSLSAYWDATSISGTLHESFWKTLKSSWLIWPIFSMVAFFVLPQNLIVPCNCVVNLTWCVILGLITQ